MMETMIQNSSKQMLIHGTHMIWMMETENSMISFKTHHIQTSTKSFKNKNPNILQKQAEQ